MKQQDEITGLVRATLSESSGEFRPCAFFDERLDCIRIITKDCSVLEERISDRVTILQNNYDLQPGRKECVGFTLKGARHLCHQNGLDMAMPLTMSKLLDAMLASFPEKVVQVFIEFVAKPLVQEQKIEHIDMSDEGHNSAADGVLQAV
jgi:hypothetical protein